MYVGDEPAHGAAGIVYLIIGTERENPENSDDWRRCRAAAQ